MEKNNIELAFAVTNYFGICYISMYRVKFRLSFRVMLLIDSVVTRRSHNKNEFYLCSDRTLLSILRNHVDLTRVFFFSRVIYAVHV